MSIKVWIAMRLQAGFRKERRAWRVVAPRHQRSPWWAVDDRRHMDFIVHDSIQMIPDFVVHKHDFPNEPEAAEFISRMCWLAAVDHLLHFWRKDP